MAYVYNGDNYRAGAAGVAADLGLRDYYAQQAAQALTSGQNYATQEQIERAKRELNPAMDAYASLISNGPYSGMEQEAVLSNSVNQVMNTTRAMQQNLNATMASRGQAANAGANLAAGMAGQFAAAGQRGQSYADLLAAKKAGQMAGLQGYADLSKAQAALTTSPIRMDVDQNDYTNLYDTWRNEQVGYDNAKWGKMPEQPKFYAEPDEKKKKKNVGSIF